MDDSRRAESHGSAGGGNRASKGRLKCDVLGIELLPDGRVVAAAARGSGDVAAEVRVFPSVSDFADQVRSGRLRAKRMNVIFPRQRCVARDLRLPSTDPAEIARMAAFEVEGAVPFAEGKTEHAFLCGVAGEDGYTPVTGFVTTDVILKEYLSTFRMNGLLPDRVVVSSVGLLAGWRARQGTSDGGPPRGALLLALDPWTTEVLADRPGGLLYSRGTALQGPGTASTEELAREGERLVAGAAERLEEKPGSVAVLASSEVVALIKAGGRALGEVHDGREAFPRICLLESAEGSAGAADGTETDWCSGTDLTAPAARAVGAALVDMHAEFASFNLLPRDLAALKKRRVVKKLVLTSAVLVGLVLALGATLVQAICLRLESRIGRLRSEIAPIEDTARAVARKRQQLLALDAHLAERALPLVVLTELYRVTPEGVNIVQLRMRGKEVDITGQADPAERAYTYLADLMESRVLTAVHFHGAHPVRRGAGAVTEFSYTCQAALTEAAAGGRQNETR